MTSTHRPHRQRPTDTHRDEGFTIVELLVVVIIIGILAGIAIPIYLHQKASAHDAAVKSDLRSIAQAVEGAADELQGPLYRGTGAYDVIDGHGHGVAVAISDATGWGIVGTASGFCVAGYAAESSRYTATSPLTYDSSAGGLGRSGGACSSTPTMSAPLTGGVGGNAPLGTGKNMLADAGFQAVPSSRLFVSATGSLGAYQSQGSAYWGFYDSPSEAGTRALRVRTTSSAVAQGVMIYPTASTPMTGKTITLGTAYTVSAWVLAPAGQSMTLAARVVTANRGWVGESSIGFTGTGSWQRVSHSITGVSTTVGQQIALQVQTRTPFPSASIQFDIAGPQIELGPAATEYEQSAP